MRAWILDLMGTVRLLICRYDEEGSLSDEDDPLLYYFAPFNGKHTAARAIVGAMPVAELWELGLCCIC